MDTPRTRAEFERNFNLLHRKIEDGQFFVQRGLTHSVSGIARVRFLPNGRMDFLSVDESARLQANMMNQMSECSFQKKIENKRGESDVLSPAESDDPTHDN